MTFRGDLLDRGRVGELVARLRPEATCHLAGLVRVRDSFRDPAAYHAVNVGGPDILLRALSEQAGRDGRAARLVFASAAALYGPAEGGPVGADAPCRPTSPYGASKLAAEELLAAYAAADAVGAVSLRCPVVAGAVGPYGDADTSRLLPKALAVAGGLQPTLVVNGDGSATREYRHVADVAEAYLLALGAARPGRHRAYNLGSGTRRPSARWSPRSSGSPAGGCGWTGGGPPTSRRRWPWTAAAPAGSWAGARFGYR